MGSAASDTEEKVRLQQGLHGLGSVEALEQATDKHDEASVKLWAQTQAFPPLPRQACRAAFGQRHLRWSPCSPPTTHHPPAQPMLAPLLFLPPQSSSPPTPLTLTSDSDHKSPRLAAALNHADPCLRPRSVRSSAVTGFTIYYITVSLAAVLLGSYHRRMASRHTDSGRAPHKAS